MISVGEYRAFRFSYHLSIVRALHDWSSHEERVAMIAASNYYAFQRASAIGDHHIAQALYNWSSEAERVSKVSALRENGIENIL